MVSSDVRNIPFGRGSAHIGTRYEVRLPRELVLVEKQLLYFERYAKLMAPDRTFLDDPDLIAFLFESSVPTVEERAG